MNIGINRNLFSQINSDSGSLSILSNIVHKFVKKGDYEVIVMKGSVISRKFTISVVESDHPVKDQHERMTTSFSISPPKQDTVIVKQINIDLKDTISEQFFLEVGGYVLFYVSSGSGGYDIEIYGYEKGTQMKVFDSKELKDDDLFSLTVIRPGTYSITNLINNAKAELVVNYPELGKMQKNPLPVRIECNTQNQISPNKIQIDPGQGLVFTFKTPSRIKIELTKPEDRPSRIRRSRITHGKTDEKRIIRKYRLMPSKTKI